MKMINNPEFTHTVHVMVPCDAGHREETFRARFRVMSSDRSEGLSVGDTPAVIDFLRAAVLAVEDIVDVEGKPIPYSGEVLEWLLGLPYTRLALLRTYMAAITKVRVGN